MDVTMTRRSFLGATACTVAVAGTGFGEEPPKTEITFLNLACTDGGAGLAVVLRTPTGKTYLFDTGNGFSPERSNGAAIVVPWLKAHGIREIDGLVVSHYHADHFGGFLSMADFPIKRIFNNNYLPKGPDGKPMRVGEALFAKMLADWEKTHRRRAAVFLLFVRRRREVRRVHRLEAEADLGRRRERRRGASRGFLSVSFSRSFPANRSSLGRVSVKPPVNISLFRHETPDYLWLFDGCLMVVDTFGDGVL